MYIPEEQQRQIGHFFLSLGFFSIKKIIGKIYQPQSNTLSPRVIQMQKNIGLLNSKITCQIKINECIEQLIACYNLQLVSERTDRTSIEGLTKTLRDFMAEQQGISEQNVIPYTEMNKFDELYTYFEVCSQELRELIAKQHTLQEEMEHVIKNQSTYINTSKAPTCGTRLFL